mmetsp:Transcript_41442/g.100613  ORF Transcript_41442/g.100613 Transcript_41442/m.100613 type:complete len:109 (+) Transcript_41442:798-1124(+)
MRSGWPLAGCRPEKEECVVAGWAAWKEAALATAVAAKAAAAMAAMAVAAGREEECTCHYSKHNVSRDRTPSRNTCPPAVRSQSKDERRVPHTPALLREERLPPQSPGP